MNKKPNHAADIRNGNWGTSGTNKTWDKAQGNRGKQLDSRQTPRTGRKLPQQEGQQGTKKQ